jgi:hypothetical protein
MKNNLRFCVYVEHNLLTFINTKIASKESERERQKGQFFLLHVFRESREFRDY